MAGIRMPESSSTASQARQQGVESELEEPGLEAGALTWSTNIPNSSFTCCAAAPTPVSAYSKIEARSLSLYGTKNPLAGFFACGGFYEV